jgi:FtsH-binding integral membrane protein
MSYEKDYGYKSSTQIVQATMSKVYAWMTLALAVSAIAAYYTASSEALIGFVYGTRWGIGALLIAEIALVIYLSARLNKMSFATGAFVFGIYSMLNGITLSSILLAYSPGTIYTAFLSTALTFGVMSLIGYTTKKDLTSIGSFLMMALVGLIIASLVNLFLRNSMMDTIITYLGLFLFIGLTAYDTQKIKQAISMQGQWGIDVRKIALIGALSLYLDFINLFLNIVRLLGDRR